MKGYKITNFVIVVLVIAAVYQTGELWLAGTTSHNFFNGIMQSASKATVGGQNSSVILPVARYAVGNGGSAFSVYYSDKFGNNDTDILKIANDTLTEILYTNIQEGEKTFADWKAMLQSRSLILQYDFALAPSDYPVHTKSKKALETLKAFDCVTLLPARHPGEESQVYFINSDTNECVLYKSNKSKTAPLLYEQLVRQEGDMVYISTGQKTTSSILKRNLFLPQWADLPYFYAAVEEKPVFEQENAVNRMTLENSVEGFFKNFSADWSTRDESGTFEFSDSSVIVKYYPAERVLEYYSYDTYGTEKDQASLSQGYGISCNFMENDASLHTDVYLADVIRRSNETIYCFDYVTDNLPVYLSANMQEKIGMKHAIEITVRGQAVKKYRRLAVDYVLKENPSEKLHVQFIDALDEANRRYQEQVEERVVRDVENIVLGYYADGSHKLSLKWFVTLYDHDFLIDTAASTANEPKE